MAATMDCICWMEGGCIIGADWWVWLGWLEEFLLSWWPGLVAIDLVRTIQPLCQRKINCKSTNLMLFHRRRQLIMHRKLVDWMLWLQWIRGCLQGLKRKKRTIKGDRGELAKNLPMLKLDFLRTRKFQLLRSGGKLTFVWCRWVLI